jgi:multiple sugar transport system substrate-binding protein
MRKLRIGLALAVACMLVAAFTGCTKKSGAQADGAVTLKWAVWDYDLTVYYKHLIDAWQSRNPALTIEYIDLGSADFMTVLGTQLSGGADLDVLCIKDIPGYANLVKQNRLEPLNGFIQSAAIDTGQYGGTVEQITMNGEVYALPFRSDFWLVFYNKDLFDAAGVPYPANDITLDEYDALARRLTQGGGAAKVYGAHYHTWRSAVQLFGILDGKHTIVDGAYDFLVPYYQRVLKEQDDGIVQSYSTLKTSGTHYSGAFFNNRIAMLNMGTWFIATQIDKVKSGESLSKNWGLVKYPHPDGVPAGTTLGTITSLAVNRNSKHKAEALDFLKFVTGPEGAAILANLGAIPAIMNDEVINAIASIDGFPGDRSSRDALYVTRAYLEMPIHEKSADIELILNEAHDNIMTKNSSVQQGIQEMNSRVGTLVKTR